MPATTTPRLQKSFGACDSSFMTNNNYCLNTCGRCESQGEGEERGRGGGESRSARRNPSQRNMTTCTDVPPDSEYNCTQQVRQLISFYHQRWCCNTLLTLFTSRNCGWLDNGYVFFVACGESSVLHASCQSAALLWRQLLLQCLLQPAEHHNACARAC
jgi:hypothetical protein